MTLHDSNCYLRDDIPPIVNAHESVGRVIENFTQKPSMTGALVLFDNGAFTYFSQSLKFMFSKSF